MATTAMPMLCVLIQTEDLVVPASAVTKEMELLVPILMNALSEPTIATPMLHAPTLLADSLVAAMQATAAMVLTALTLMSAQATLTTVTQMLPA